MVLQRVVHVAMLSDVGREVGFDVMVERLVPLLPVCVVTMNGCSQLWLVRLRLFAHSALPGRAKLCFGCGQPFLLGKLAGDSHPDVRAEERRLLLGA